MATTTVHNPRLASPVGKAALGLSQRGRAGLEVLGAMQAFTSSTFRPKAKANFYDNPEGRALGEAWAQVQTPQDVRRRVSEAADLAHRDPIYRMERFVQRYVAEENFARGIPAIEERRAQLDAMKPQPPQTPAGGTLKLDPSLTPPKYYAGTEWHLEPGGWEGYDLYGPMFGLGVLPYVFSKGGFAAVPVGSDSLKLRTEVLRQLPKSNYERVFEPGCSGFGMLGLFHKLQPQAKLHGCDLSGKMLESGHRVAEQMGVELHLTQADATKTGEPDEAYDAVIIFALNHELPPKANVALFKEMFRILKPGGDILIGDPPPFRAVDPFHAATLAWEDDNRNEPFFSAACLADWEQVLSEVGFIDLKAYALGEDCYPWVTLGAKPALV
jgi:SAM-dependent methyltransferase